MLSVAEALDLVLQQASTLPPCRVELSAASGRVLAEDVRSDVDSPPHDKSIVDGYAVVAADVRDGKATLSVLEEVVAGDVPRERVVSGTATRIMTGAPIPEGADAVVMVEQTKFSAEAGTSRGIGTVVIDGPPVATRQNILPRGVSVRQGDVVLSAGHKVRPCDVGIAAEAGAAEVCVYSRPNVAVLSTGNELVRAFEKPSAGQIRNSNGPMLCALAESAGASVIDLGIGRDDKHELRRLIERGLQSDVLVLSGGVSAGVLDLVPGVLAELGVKEIFHKVRLKPGKPLWFGVKPLEFSLQAAEDLMLSVERGKQDTLKRGLQLVFGLPGNPVSSFVGFELFVRPALKRLAGDGSKAHDLLLARLAEDFSHRGDRPTYHPAELSFAGREAVVRPLPWRGSADLAAFAAANALIAFPPGTELHAAGADVTVMRVG
jgi:molybdopterin molybdotransferase